MLKTDSYVKRALSCLLVFVLLLSPVPFSARAATDIEARADRVLSYDGLGTRFEGVAGVRSLYSVDTEALRALEDDGCTVVYGAVMALSSYEENAINTTRSLTVTGNATDGYITSDKHARAVVVYATGAPSYATGIHLDEDWDSFAYTTVYPDKNAEEYGATLVYAGFVAVTDSNGNQTLVYDYAEDERFGRADSLYGPAASLCTLASYYVNDYSESAVKAYTYNQNALLRSVLTLCGKEIKTASSPIALTPIDMPVSLCKSVPQAYVAAARAAYTTSAYADYTTSVVSDYRTQADLYYDRPLPVTISWSPVGGEVLSYIMTLATDADFTQNVQTVGTYNTSVDIYNLLAGTTYYYKVSGMTADGYSYETEALTLQTADTVRWINVDGVRNVRDLGGWNGMNQGLVYRGSELNITQSYGTAVSVDGISVMVEDLGIVTDLDFRPASANGGEGSSSPLGEDVTWENHPISAFLSAFEAGNGYTSTMKVFTDYDNYPIYMHCVGGADRTGTVAFMLAGLCGASEEDLAIDLELTSFSKFGYRYRYDNTTYLYASLVSRLKAFPGDTLQAKFESCFRDVYGFTLAEISNIQAINTQNGAVYRLSDEERGNVYYDTAEDESFSFSFVMRNSRNVTAVTVDGTPLHYFFDAEAATLTVYGEGISDDLASGVGRIAFDDGATLRFYLETDRSDALLSAILSGDHAKLFAGAEIDASSELVTVLGSTFELPAAIAELLCNAGIEAVDLALPSGVTVTRYSKAGAVLSEETLASGKIVSIPLDGGRVVFTSSRAKIDIFGSELVSTEEARIRRIQAGDYKSFFAMGTNGNAADGTPVLHVTAANFSVSSSTLEALTAEGYTHISFTVDITFATGTTGCCLAIRHADARYEYTYPALTSADGRVQASITLRIDDTTKLQLITRTCLLDQNGDPIVASGYTQAAADSFIISDLTFSKGGTENIIKS